jgi:hypothetical protein
MSAASFLFLAAVVRKMGGEEEQHSRREEGGDDGDVAGSCPVLYLVQVPISAEQIYQTKF